MAQGYFMAMEELMLFAKDLEVRITTAKCEQFEGLLSTVEMDGLGMRNCLQNLSTFAFAHMRGTSLQLPTKPFLVSRRQRLPLLLSWWK